MTLNDFLNKEVGFGLSYFEGALQASKEECASLEKALHFDSVVSAGTHNDHHLEWYHRNKQWEMLLQALRKIASIDPANSTK